MEDKLLVSVVVPTKNSENTLLRCLESVKNQTYNKIEIITVDNASMDKTREIAERFGEVYVKGPERSAQRNFGARKANGDYLLFIDSDMELTPNVVEECVKKVLTEKLSGIIVPEISIGEGFWAKCKALEKSCYTEDEAIEAPRFFEKRVFWEVGGYDEEMAGPEDWDLFLRIRKMGYDVSRISALIRHNEGRLGLYGSMMKKYCYGKSVNKYIKAHPHMARKQLTMFRSAYFRNWRKLVKDPVHTLGLIAMKFCELGAGGLGLVRSRLRI